MSEKSFLITESPPSYPGSWTLATVDQPGVLPCPVTAGNIRPQNYLGLAFFALLCCCCWPAFIFAIIGIVFSVQVDSQYTNKDFLGAKRSSDLARNCSIAAIATGLVTLLTYLAFRVVCHIIDAKSEDGSGEE